jgi:xylan 1,4-beta-xylosidase
VSGRNWVTGEAGTRLDFISFHTKGGGYRAEVKAAKQTPTIHQLVQNAVVGLDIVERFPELAGREVVLTEADPDGRAAYGKHDNDNLRFRNWAYYASYVATAVCKFSDLGSDGPNRVDGMLTWAFEFEDREYFEGLRTLSTNGIDKPVLNVFRLLAHLGGARLMLESDAARAPEAILEPDSADTRPEISGLAALNERGEIQVLLVSHHDDWDVAEPTRADLRLENLSLAGRYRMRRTVIDHEHSNSHTLWQRLGEPQHPTVEQLTALKRAGLPELVEERDLGVEDGALALQIDLAAHSVCLLTFEPRK